MLSLELSDVLHETEMFTDWHTLSVFLKISKGELDDIEKRLLSQGSRRCKTKLFSLWIDRDRNASWKQLALALEKCKQSVSSSNLHAPPTAVASKSTTKAFNSQKELVQESEDDEPSAA